MRGPGTAVPGARDTDFWLTTAEGLLSLQINILSLDTPSLDKGNAVRLLFPQLYRVRTLMRPLWGTMGRRVSREPGSQETYAREYEHNLRNGRL